MNYFGGCDAGSTYTKSVIIDETGAIKTSVINKSRINPVLSAREALDAAVSQVDDLASAEDLTYLVGTGYGRNKVPLPMKTFRKSAATPWVYMWSTQKSNPSSTSAGRTSKASPSIPTEPC